MHQPIIIHFRLKFKIVYQFGLFVFVWLITQVEYKGTYLINKFPPTPRKHFWFLRLEEPRTRHFKAPRTRLKPFRIRSEKKIMVTRKESQIII